MAIEYSARVARIPVYPAASAYALPEDVALLASNESPDPPLPQVVEAVTRVLGGLNRYPDPTNARLRGALSDRYGVPSARIAIGNGSCDVLLALGEALLEPGAELVYAWPSFSVYPHLEAASGATGVRVPLDDATTHDLEAMLEQITVATRLVIVCNPNNPTSTALPAARIADFVARVPRHVCVLVDEAYCEFNTLDDPDTHDRPARAAPEPRPAADVQQGLRARRAARRLRALRQLGDRHRRQPGAPAVLLQRRRAGRGDRGAAPPGRGRRARRARGRWRAWRSTGGLGEIGVEVAELAGELLLARRCPGTTARTAADEERRVVEELGRQGVLVRAGTALGRAGWLRVTYGTPAQNARFLAALEQALGAVARVR